MSNRDRLFSVETRISVLKEKLKDSLRPEFSIETVLKGNDKLTRFYTGMPKNCF